MTLWEDATAAAAEEEAKGLAAKAGATQALSNAAASGQHEKAARLALKLNHPHALFVAINAMLADGESGHAALDSLAGSIKGKALHRFLAAVREWNANARHCDAAQRCMSALFRLRSLSELSRVPGARDTAAALRAYTQRHFARAGRLLRSTYLLDVALAGMGVLLDDEEGGEGEGEGEGEPGSEKSDGGGLIAEMVKNWGGAEAPTVDEVNMIGASLGATAKPAAKAPVLTRKHVGGDDADDFDLDDDEDDEAGSDEEDEGDESDEEPEPEPRSETESESEPEPEPGRSRDRGVARRRRPLGSPPRHPNRSRRRRRSAPR